MPIGLTGGDGTRSAIRMFYTPYPTLMTRPETLQAIVEDVAFGKRFYAPKTDYSGQYTPELAAKEYERFMQLTVDPGTTLGLSRDVEED